MNIDIPTLKNLLNQWEEGIVPDDGDLQDLIDFFKLMQVYFERRVTWHGNQMLSYMQGEIRALERKQARK